MGSQLFKIKFLYVLLKSEIRLHHRAGAIPKFPVLFVTFFPNHQRSQVGTGTTIVRYLNNDLSLEIIIKIMNDLQGVNPCG